MQAKTKATVSGGFCIIRHRAILLTYDKYNIIISVSNIIDIPEGVSFQHFNDETLVLERVDDVVSACLEPVHIYSFNHGTALTGLRHAADYLGMHPNTVAKYLDSGVLKHITLPSKTRRIRVDSLKELHARMYQETQEEHLSTDAQSDPEVNAPFEEANGHKALVYLGDMASRTTLELPNLNYQISNEGHIGIPLKGLQGLHIASQEAILWVRPIDYGLSNGSGLTVETIKTKEENLYFANGAVMVDTNLREVTVDGKRAHFPNREFSLLQFFIINKGISLTRQQILESIWGDWYSSYKIVDVNVGAIRKGLGNYRYLIKTIHSRGYVFDDFPPPKDT
jgi:hypothetical protein